MKRIIFYLLCILLFISIYKDLTTGNSLSKESTGLSFHSPQSNYTIIQLKITNGDTVLAITEEINDDKSNQLDIDMMMADFKQLNPAADPYRLKPESFYYFPLYK